MADSTTPAPQRLWQIGDRVRIRYSGFGPGKIVEDRGLLGPGGIRIFTVRISRKPLKPIIVEVREDQLIAVVTKASPPPDVPPVGP